MTPFGDLAERPLPLHGALLPGVLFSPFTASCSGRRSDSAFLGLGALAVTDHRGKAMALAVVLEIYMISGYAVAFGRAGQRLFISSLPFAAVGLAVFGEQWRSATPLARDRGWLGRRMVEHVADGPVCDRDDSETKA